MNKRKFASKTALFFSLFLIAGTTSGCSGNSNAITLHILNMEDYIYLNNPKDGYNEPNIYDQQFKAYLNENYPEFKNKNIQIIYDTTDTNETLYSKLQTGKSNYDLICPSDYMIQKLLSQDALEPLNKELIPNYYGENSKASPWFKKISGGIKSQSYKTKQEYSLLDYSVGYMWGTLGIIYNPQFKGFTPIAKQDVNTDMKHWSSLWDQKYNKTFSIKNSMRDTYAVGIMETFKDELTAIQLQYKKGEITLTDYQNKLSEIFNRSSDEYSKQVFDTLYRLKDNAFGLEVDSGKQDIVTGKIGINTAWSGDAVYSISQAADPKQVTETFDLYYSIPDLGANIWFDSWVMPKLASRSDETKQLACAFLNFLSDPIYAQKNMDYTGYTSCIAGQEVHDYVMDLYDVRNTLVTYSPDEEHAYDIFYIDPFSGSLTIADYSDFAKEIDESYKTVELRYYKGEYYEEEGKYYSKDSKKELVFTDLTTFKEKNNYYDRFIIDENIEPYKSANKVDLKYFFEGTLDDEEDYIFYTNQYCLENAEDTIGGAFFAQFPSETAINRCAVMRDYRENNQTIMKRWEDFKSSAIPTWAIVLISVQVGLLLCLVSYFVINKAVKKSLRKKRIKSSDN